MRPWPPALRLMRKTGIEGSDWKRSTQSWRFVVAEHRGELGEDEDLMALGTELFEAAMGKWWRLAERLLQTSRVFFVQRFRRSLALPAPRFDGVGP